MSEVLPEPSRMLGQVGLEDWQLCRLLLRYPRVVEYPLEHLRARLRYFTDLGLTRAQLEQASRPVSTLRCLSSLPGRDKAGTVGSRVLACT